MESVLREAFDSVQKHDLKPNTIICTVCGCALRVDDESTKPCEHLKELASGCSSAW